MDITERLSKDGLSRPTEESAMGNQDIERLHERIDAVIKETSEISKYCSNIDGRLTGTLPHLATRDFIIRKFGDHVIEYHKKNTPKSIVPPAYENKSIVKLVGLVVVLSTVLVFVIKELIRLLSQLV